MRLCSLLSTLMFALMPSFANAATLDGSSLSFWWALPFAGILICIATGPVLYSHFWEHHYGKISAAWIAAALIPLAVTFGPWVAFESAMHAILFEYMSFIILLFALYTIAGGVVVRGNLHGSPLTNSAIMLVGMGLASFVGTTGASMILIRPLIRANDNRRHNVHTVVFFIFLVSNIGGSLTPLGDPPLFVGFLRGVDFFWTTQFLWKETLLVGSIVLTVFFLMDTYLYKKEGLQQPLKDPPADCKIGLEGLVNLPLLGGVIAAILMSATWKPGITFSVPGGTLELQNLFRDGILVLLALVSLKLTKEQHRLGNGFTWGPIQEVAKLFLCIFITMIPVLAMLKAGASGAFAPLVALVSNPDGSPNNLAYFWLTGGLSSFLDNAPTYLVFFELAGGDAKELMGPLAGTLTAISTGAVYMGANTYIGNAPNFMVYAIAKHRGVKMPSFFGYMLWSGAILIPTFLLVGFLFFGI
jgi:Na+/H+ antiporter NhaD/arsenite permease-like protein